MCALTEKVSRGAGNLCLPLAYLRHRYLTTNYKYQKVPMPDESRGSWHPYIYNTSFVQTTFL